MSNYSFQIIYKPIIDMYVKLQDDLLEYSNYATQLKKLESESDEDYIKKIEKIVTKIQDSDKEAMHAIGKLFEINSKKERKSIPGHPEFYKTTENLALILKLLHELKDSKYADAELEKLLERVIFFFFDYTLKMCDSIYATHTVKNERNEKPN